MTSLRDSRAAFEQSPRAASTISLSTQGGSPFSSGGQKRQSRPPLSRGSSSQPSSTKGKSTRQLVANIKTQVDGIDKAGQDRMAYASERYNMKMQVKLRDKEIAYLKSENEFECTEAEKIHQCQLKQKEVDLQVRQADAEKTHQRQLEQKKVDLQICQADALAFDKKKSVLELKLQLALAEVEQAKWAVGAGVSLDAGEPSDAGIPDTT